MWLSKSLSVSSAEKVYALLRSLSGIQKTTHSVDHKNDKYTYKFRFCKELENQERRY